jgi:hypothetical protein
MWCSTMYDEGMTYPRAGTIAGAVYALAEKQAAAQRAAARSTPAPALRNPIPQPVSTNATPEELKKYKTDYNRGWNYSNNSADPSLDHLDRKGASEAEYDGYFDAAASRDKWHLLNCPDHDACGQG